MEVLVAVALGVALVLPAGVLRLPAWLAGADEPAGAASRPPAPESAPGLLSRDLVRRRLDALTEELDRLDTDPDVFARGFRTTVARSAYEALLADAAAAAREPAAVHLGAPDIELEVVAGTRRAREELEL